MKPIQAFVATHPKAGATWLRFMLAHYLATAHRLGSAIDLKSMAQSVPYRPPQKDAEPYLYDNRPEIPLVCFSHNMPDFPEYRLTNKIVLLVRNPFAMVTSRFFHVAHHAPDPEAGSMTDAFEFAMRGRDGLANTRGFLNGWAPEIKKCGGLVLTYEEMDLDIRAAFTKFLTFCEIPIDRTALLTAVERSGKSSMIDAERRNPLNPDSPLDGRKARVHFVGHYTSHFSTGELKAMRDLFLDGLNQEARQLLEDNGIYPTVFDPVENEARRKRLFQEAAALGILKSVPR